MNDVLRKVTDFRLITLAVASALAIAAVKADARPADGRVKAQHSGTSSVQRSRGADGAVDATRTNRKGGATTVDRYKDGSGTTDATITGPHGGVTNVDRTRCADGADTNDNSVDFLLKTNTPGATNACAVTPPPLGNRLHMAASH